MICRFKKYGKFLVRDYHVFMPRSYYRQLLLEIAMKQSSEHKGPPGGEKSREQVLAEREAKRLAKQNAKGKKETPSAINDAQVPQSKVDEVKVVEVAAQPVETTSKAAECKTREEILAERAAKKQEKKQGGKTKPKNNENKPPTIAPAEADPQPGKEGPVEKSKAQLRAERRELQEAQRAKKEGSVKVVKSNVKPDVTKTEEKMQKLPTASSKTATAMKTKKIAVDTSHRVKMFAHLYAQAAFNSRVLIGVEDVHPTISLLGAQYRTRVVCGSNVRCLALLAAFKRVIEDFRSPLNEDLSRGLGAELTRSIAFLNRCRPVSVSMTNAVKHLKAQLTKCKGSEPEVKEELLDWIDTYVKEQLEKAAEAISITVRQKIADGDVILTYGFSSLIEKILIAAAKEGIRFRVVVVDGRPWREGRELLRRLLLVNIPCTYVLVNAISFIMPQVTKILLGAHALLANGYVMSRCGSSQVALMGRTMNVPVLVCCETHKFSERVQTDSFVHNELGSPDELLGNKRCRVSSIPAVTSLSVMYDVTPPDLVSAVVTELAVLPCTSVPVILRIK